MKDSYIYIHNGVLTSKFKANAIQSTSQYAELDSTFSGYLAFVTPHEVDEVRNRLLEIIPSGNFDLMPYKSKFSWIRLALVIIGRKSRLYTRSWFAAIVGAIFTKKAVFECHGKVVSNHKLVNDAIFIALKMLRIKFVVISDPLRDFLIETKNIDSFVLHDGVSEKFINAARNEIAHRKEDLYFDFREKFEFISVYSGKISSDRGITYIYQLAKERQDTCFVIFGDDSEFTQELTLENVKFMGYVDNEILPSYLLQADILLLLWTSDVPTIDICSPLKLFEYAFLNIPTVGFYFPFMNGIDLVSNMFLSSEETIAGLLREFNAAIEIGSMTKLQSKLNYHRFTYRTRAIEIVKIISQ